MCSYAAINGTFACENPVLQKNILRNDFGFQGFVTSDWGGTHSTVASANNGLDMEMNGSDFYGAQSPQRIGRDSHLRAGNRRRQRGNGRQLVFDPILGCRARTFGQVLHRHQHVRHAGSHPRRSDDRFIWGGQSPLAGGPATGWSTKWTGTLTPPTTGTYQFAMTSDDGSRLIINGQTVVNNWFNQPATTRTGNITLTAGQPVSIVVDYFQDGGGSVANLSWKIPNQNLHDPAVAAARASDLAVVFVSNAGSEGADLSNIDLSGVQSR
jgi:hypothetical protein